MDEFENIPEGMPDTNDEVRIEAPEAPTEYAPEPEFRPEPIPAADIPVPRPQPPRKPRGAAAMIAVALSCSLLGGALGAGGAFLFQRSQKGQSSAPTDPTAPSQNVSTLLQGQREETKLDITDIETGKLMTAAQVYAANVNSTVGITTSITTNYWGYQSTAAASGSGFIITADGYILTNFHVIEDSDSITVSTFKGDEYEAALIGYDESNDIAVLKVEAEGLTPVVLGDSDDLNVGDDVVAIGNPLGELTFSLTAGKVSAKDREVTFSNNVTMDLIQTDCAINSGNSGGALFNMYGEVIGVTNAKYSGSSNSGASIDNIGFAIPLNSIRTIVESIIEKGYISKPYLGVSVSDVTEEYQIYGLPQGAAVQQIVEDSPAAKAGLQVGDIITKIGTTEITGSAALVDHIRHTTPGDKLTLTVYRKGQTMELTVTIEEQIQSALEDKEEDEDAMQQYPGYDFPWGDGFGGW